MNTDDHLPVIDLDKFIDAHAAVSARQKEADKCAKALSEYGAFILRDTRANANGENDDFLDLLEDYFSQHPDKLKLDERPQYHYQVGVTLEDTERPKCQFDEDCKLLVQSLTESDRPSDYTGSDAKCRFFHRMGHPAANTKFPSLSMENVTPDAFRDRWNHVLETWGSQMHAALNSVLEMLEMATGLDPGYLREAAKHGSHLLGPTGTSLSRYGQIGSIFAGFHTDLNALTIHGPSRYPGLFIWTREMRKMAVKLPKGPGYLLVQAGKQIEQLTAGYIKAGYHEVVCTQATLDEMERRRRDPATKDRPQVRVSSTYFLHFASDFVLRPSEFTHLAKRIANSVDVPVKYEDMYVGTLVERELEHIGLKV